MKTGSKLAELTAIAVLVLAFSTGSSGQNKGAVFPAGNSSWISAPALPDLAPATGLTVEAWVWVANSTAPLRPIIYVPSTGTEFSYLFYVAANLQGNYASFQADTVGGPPWGTISVESVTFTSGTWHHLAATYDGFAAKMYTDGVVSQVWNQAGFLRPPSNQVQIGTLNGGYFNNGSIDCIRIWSYARSQAEIATYRFFEIPSMPGLVASWHLNGDLTDSTGAHDGTAVGTISMLAPGAPITPMLAAPPALGIGNVLTLQISTPFPNVPYILDVSTTGTSPGVPLTPSIVIPLNQPWLNYDSGGLLTPYFSNFLGITDMAGGAQAFVTVPAVEALAGFTISATYALLQPGVPYSVGYVAPPTDTVLAGLPPVILGVSPSIGPTSGGTQITITGDRFVAGATVHIGSASATGVSVTDATHIVCTTPPASIGPKSISVTNPDTVSGTLDNAFTYVVPIVISQVSPLVSSPGTSVTVTGSNFQSGVVLAIGGIPVTPTSATATQLTFVNPPGVPCNATLQVTNPNGLMASTVFNPSPTTSGLLPASGSAAGGNTVSVFGNYFFPGTTVTVNGVSAALTVFGSSFASVVMPPGTPGPAQVVFTSTNGCAVTAPYTYL